MKMLVLGAAIAASVLGAVPASAQVVIQQHSDRDGVVVREHMDREHMDNGRHEGWRHSRAECREIRVRTRLGNGRVIFRTRRVC